MGKSAKRRINRLFQMRIDSKVVSSVFDTDMKVDKKSRVLGTPMGVLKQEDGKLVLDYDGSGNFRLLTEEEHKELARLFYKFKPVSADPSSDHAIQGALQALDGKA